MYGVDADESALRAFAKLYPINTRVDLATGALVFCKDPYGRFYNTQSSFNSVCPLMGFHNKTSKKEEPLKHPTAGEFMKLMPTNLRELRWILEKRMNIPHIPKVFLQTLSDVENYKNICIFKPNNTVYVCGFAPILINKEMPVNERNSLCPYGSDKKPYTYSFSYDNDEYTEVYPDEYTVPIRAAIFRENCFAKAFVIVHYIGSGKNNVDISFQLRVYFQFIKESPKEVTEPIEILGTTFVDTVQKAVNDGLFVHDKSLKAKQAFKTYVLIPSNSLELTMKEVTQLIKTRVNFPKCFYMSGSDQCIFEYKPYCDQNHRHSQASGDTVSFSLTSIGQYHCLRDIYKQDCDGNLRTMKTIVKIMCMCHHFMCDDPYANAKQLGYIKTELEKQERCFVSSGGLIANAPAKNSAFCYMSIKRMKSDKSKVISEYGVLDMDNPREIVNDVWNCKLHNQIEDALFAPKPAHTSCQMTNEHNVTVYQCCCRTSIEPCNTERLIKKYFTIQTTSELHSCQFHSLPTGPCAGSRYDQFRCIGVFDLTQSNGFKNTKEDCVSSHLDNDRAHTLCRQYGGIINPHGGTCGMMAMYDMRKGQTVNETNIPIYICCGDAYHKFQKTLRTKKLKRISDLK
uniref:DNA-directed DNA polymerase n=1 Tax=Panagrellus redivivus TaxID=6233 RepID=A0A7E4V6J5_PANRE